MSSFQLDVFTPESRFFDGEVESLVLSTLDGKLGILSGHEPIVASLVPGEISIRIHGVDRTAVCTGGFMEMLGEQAYIFVQSIEWIEDIDRKRALDAMERAKRHLAAAEEIQNTYEIRRFTVALKRAETRLNALDNLDNTKHEEK